MVGDSKVLNSWVHDTKESTSVIFNQSWWPGVSEGDLLSMRGSNSEYLDVFLFMVPRDDGCAKHQLQISIPKPIAKAFRLRNNSEAIAMKVHEDNCAVEYVEFIFQDQYLGRNDMWRLGEHLVGQCIYNQDITFIGNIAAKIQNIYISALMTHATKAIYRSLSAKVTIFIQVCHELWEFAGNGEHYNEKIVHSFLPTLFTKWCDADEADVGYAAGLMRRDNYGRWLFPSVEVPLLRLTTTWLLDQGFGLNMVSLAKKPLHQSPIFSFQGTDPEVKMDTEGKSAPHSMDPLWCSVDDPNDSSSKKTFWWEPFWVSISFGEMQLHLPFREDRFVGQAKMHQIQMLGLLDFDVASSIEVPSLPKSTDYSPACSTEDIPISKAEVDKFDMVVFAPKPGPRNFNPNRDSVASLSGLTICSNERQNSHRNSVIASKIAPIEESPKRVIVNLPPEDFTSTLDIPMFSGLSTSLSQSSIHSLCSAISSKASCDTSARGTLAKLAPSWLFSPFRSGPSEPQTSQVSASSTPSTPSTLTLTQTNPLPQVPTLTCTSTPSKPSVASQVSHSPMPMAIKGATQVTNRLSIIRTLDDDGLGSQQGSYICHSPLNSPPWEEANFGKRLSTASIATQFSSPFSVIALVVMQGMVAVRLAQGFQFMLRAPMGNTTEKCGLRWMKSFLKEEDLTPKPIGPTDMLCSTADPVYLSGYTELLTTFAPHGLENYGWNRLDMLFIVIPTAEPHTSTIGPSGEKHNDKEMRILGIEKLSDQFTRLRQQPAEDRKLDFEGVHS
ncbi:hypothetical protein L208DRAFT_1380438 [Tricholoma matsutake]|nr:hypothetical protein L208DRAFT_1380438 [Tricholoma matsutake 945]